MDNFFNNFNPGQITTFVSSGGSSNTANTTSASSTPPPPSAPVMPQLPVVTQEEESPRATTPFITDATVTYNGLITGQNIALR